MPPLIATTLEQLITLDNENGGQVNRVYSLEVDSLPQETTNVEKKLGRSAQAHTQLVCFDSYSEETVHLCVV